MGTRTTDISPRFPLLGVIHHDARNDLHKQVTYGRNKRGNAVQAEGNAKEARPGRIQKRVHKNENEGKEVSYYIEEAGKREQICFCFCAGPGLNSL